MKTLTWFWEEIEGNPRGYLNVLAWELTDTGPDGLCWEQIGDLGERSYADGQVDPREIVSRAMREFRIHDLQPFGQTHPDLDWLTLNQMVAS